MTGVRKTKDIAAELTAGQQAPDLSQSLSQLQGLLPILQALGDLAL